MGNDKKDGLKLTFQFLLAFTIVFFCFIKDFVCFGLIDLLANVKLQIRLIYTYCMTESFYEVEEIIDKKRNKNKVLYKIKWKGYTVQQSTWEKETHLKNVKDLIEEYEQKHSESNSGKVYSSSMEKTNKILMQSAKYVSSELEAKEIQRNRNANSLQHENSRTRFRQKKNVSMPESNNINTSLGDPVNQVSKMAVDCQKAAKMIDKNQNEEKCLGQKKKQKKQKRKEKLKMMNQTTQERAVRQTQDYSIQELLQPVQQKQDLNRVSFQTPHFKNSQTISNDQASSDKKKQLSSKIPQQTTQNLQSQQSQMNQINATEVDKENNISVQEIKGQVEAAISKLNKQGAQEKDRDKEDKDDKKSVETISSHQSLCKSIQERLQSRSEDGRVGNLTIKLLEPDDKDKGDIRQYLVQYEDNSLKVFSSIELVVQHPLQFILYLQTKAYGKKR